MDKVPGVRTGRTGAITAPRATNRELDAGNPDSRVPPLSDTGSMPVFKYPFSLANKRVYRGGWSREVTARELPIAKELAGVNMRLEAGGIRELHWHKAAEWSIMLYGAARITAIDAQGRSFVRDVFAGDLWYFPTGIRIRFRALGRMALSFFWSSMTAISPSMRPCFCRMLWHTRRQRSCPRTSVSAKWLWRAFRRKSSSSSRLPSRGRLLWTARARPARSVHRTTIFRFGLASRRPRKR